MRFARHSTTETGVQRFWLAGRRGKIASSLAKLLCRTAVWAERWFDLAAFAFAALAGQLVFVTCYELRSLQVAADRLASWILPCVDPNIARAISSSLASDWANMEHGHNVDQTGVRRAAEATKFSLIPSLGGQKDVCGNRTPTLPASANHDRRGGVVKLLRLKSHFVL
ncbi:hypothetical protein [Mesorhizobium sp. GbtcB19]|uniref:hypothetical protein n=1 Tax=Mesorhizobium sp. GbtcB19 TaxID=2824764 RepID=UPI001C302188|nr:hypothetical protein [Mesorhizobium sp. GbtcB19]